MANQFVVQLKNEPGAMATLAEALAARGVDLRAIGGGSMGDSGHVIMTTADDDATKVVLDEGGYTYIEGESILTEVDGVADFADLVEGVSTKEQTDEISRRILDIRMKRHPLKRQSYGRDIAQACVFLGSDRAAQVTGIVLPVDAGSNCGDPQSLIAEIAAAREGALG